MVGTTDGAPRGLLLAGVAFDGQMEALVAAAVSMARRFQMEVRLIHVVEPVSPELLALDYSATMYAYPPVLLPTVDELVSAAKDKLDTLVATLAKTIRVTGAVLVGRPVTAILGEATSRQANLILTACDVEAYGALSGGVSTTLGLMHEASIPVLVVNRGSKLDLSAAGFRILLADDLQDATREAARKTYELASKLDHAAVRHVHVHGDLREILRDTWREARGDGQAAALAAEYAARVERLEERGRPFRERARETGAQLAVDVRTGAVGDQLKQAMSEFDPQLVVFGRHRLLQAKPFLIGRMPLRTMLHERRPVLLVPPTGELAVRLPFPAS